MLLAADIGGTKSWLQACDQASGRIVADSLYASADFQSLGELINHFRTRHQLPAFAASCLGLPGPVNGRLARLTNLPWEVSADTLEAKAGTGPVQLINDFQAAALGIDAVAPEQLVCLHAGEPDAQGHRLVVGAGTGLGVSPVVWTEQGHIPIASEGGHMDFAPTTAEHQKMLSWLWPAWPHLSYERVLSGPGLQVLYLFHSGAAAPDEEAPAAAEISAMADAGDPVATAAMNSFVSIYGSFLGSAALLWPARGGIYIAGGIAAKIQSRLQAPVFLQALHDKGRMSSVVNKMPVILVTDPGLGLKGAMLQVTKNAEQLSRGFE